MIGDFTQNKKIMLEDNRTKFQRLSEIIFKSDWIEGDGKGMC
jgi:hypothetical protein